MSARVIPGSGCSGEVTSLSEGHRPISRLSEGHGPFGVELGCFNPDDAYRPFHESARTEGAGEWNVVRHVISLPVLLLYSSSSGSSLQVSRRARSRDDGQRSHCPWRK